MIYAILILDDAGRVIGTIRSRSRGALAGDAKRLEQQGIPYVLLSTRDLDPEQRQLLANCLTQPKNYVWQDGQLTTGDN